MIMLGCIDFEKSLSKLVIQNNTMTTLVVTVLFLKTMDLRDKIEFFLLLTFLREM